MTNKGRKTMDNWEPIETAPKDGTQILCCEQYRVSKIGYSMGGDVYIGRCTQGEWIDYEWFNHNGFCVPTHWQPLPKATKEKGNG